MSDISLSDLLNPKNINKILNQGSDTDIVAGCKDQFKTIMKKKDEILGHFYSNTSLLMVFIIGILTIVVGSLSMQIYNDCPPTTSSSNIFANKLGTTFAIGFGIGICLFALFHFLFKYTSNLPIILISLILIAIPSWNIHNIDNLKTNCSVANVDSQLDYALVMLGAGIGMMLGMIMTVLPMRALLKIRIFSVLLTMIMIVFSIIGINTYQKCDKPTKSKTPLTGLGVILGLSLLIFVGVLVSFYFVPPSTDLPSTSLPK